MSFTNSFVNCDDIKTYMIINEIIVFEICERLQIESFFFSNLNLYENTISSSLNDLLYIIYYYFQTFTIIKKKSYLFSIIQLKYHDLIFEKF